MSKLLLTVHFIMLAVFGSVAAELHPSNLRCEYRQDPMGLDVPQPRLSWNLEATSREKRGLSQSAYRVLVASTSEKLAANEADLWDSGKVSSGDQIQVSYGGKPLKSRQRCYWKLRVWDQQGKPCEWSPPAMWSMGLLAAADWQAEWISATDHVERPRPARAAGYHAREAAKADEVKWVQVDLGGEYPVDEVVLYPPTPPGFETVRGFGFPLRFRIDVSHEPNGQAGKTIADLTQEDFPNPGDQARSFEARGIRARYVRVTATKLWNRGSGSEPFCFALGELEVISGGKNVALHASASTLDSVERDGWKRTQLTDGVRLLKSTDLDQSANYRPERTNGEREGKDALDTDVPPYAAVLLRKELELAQQPVRAVAYVCGLGYYELYINGIRVGDHVLDPGFTDYTRRVLYVTYDVTKLLPTGRNSVGVILGTGWFDSPAIDVWNFHAAPWISPPKLLLQLEVEYGDGSRQIIASDHSWKYSTGPIVFNSIRGGETYDGRREKPGWDKPGFEDSAWTRVKVVSAPKGRLMAQSHPPIRALQTVRPVAVGEPQPGVYVFDMGINMVGWARFQTRGERGSRIKLEFCELLNKDGTLDKGLGVLTTGRFQTGEFILKGEGTETYEPRFTYHGFRYVQITGLKDKPTLDSLTGRWVHTDPENAGEFSCSNPLVNRVQEMILRTQLSNVHGIPTDCPHREKIGWTADGCITMEEAIYNFQMATFYVKWFRDMLEAQDENGHASCIAPSPGWGKSELDGSPSFLSDPWWGGAIVRAPWQLYRYYGDRRILAEGYDAMKRYLDYAARYSPGNISWSNEGDWLEVGSGGTSERTPNRLAGTAVYFYHATLLAEIATLLGHNEDAQRYHRHANDIAASFHQRYFDAATGLYARDSQTAQALPLYFGMTPSGMRPLVLDQLLKNIRATRTNHISTGIIGTHYVFQTLMESGRDDLAYAMLTQQDFPSWGPMLRGGGATMWESWNGAGSRNHPALGSVGAWFYQGLGGIRLDPVMPAFKRFVLKPAVVGDLAWVECSYPSVHGRIKSNWRREGGRLRLEVTIPVNTAATVYVPTTHAAEVTESGRPAAGAAGVKFLRTSKEAAVYEVGSGNYVFESPFHPVDPSNP